MRLGKTALYHFASQVVISVSGFAATFVIVALLGANDLGLYRTAVGIGFFWLVIPAAGVAQAIKKRMSEGEQPRQYFGGGVLINAALAMGMGAIVLTAGWLLRATNPPDVVLVRVLVNYDFAVAALVVGGTTLQTSLAGLEGEKRVARSGWTKAVDRVGRSAVQILLIAGGFGVTAITLGHAGVLVLVAALSMVIAGLRPARPTREHLGSLVAYARYAWMGALRGRVYGWMDTIVLSLFISTASLVGIYELAWGIGSLLATVSASISSTLFPEVSDLSSDGDYERVRHFLDEALAFSGLIVIPGLAGAAVIGPRILRFIGPGLAAGSTVLVILVGAYVADIYATQFLNVVNGVDRPDIALRVNSAFILTNAVLNVALVLTIGWQGAAIATAVSACLRMLLSYASLVRILDRITLPLRPIGAQVLAAIVMAGVVAAVEGTVPAGRAGTLALVAGGAVLYFATLLAISTRVRSKTLSLVPLAA